MSSFRKRNVQKPIQGTRTSAQTGQVITSSGNPSFDLLLGGGLPIGSICLIEEDKFVTHAKVLAKYFLAEGVFSNQTIFLGSLDDDPRELLSKLPPALDKEEIEREKAIDKDFERSLSPPQNGLRIAWRYNDLPLVNSERTMAKIGHHFNLMEQIDPVVLDFADTYVWDDKPIINEVDDINEKIQCDEDYDLDISGDEVENYIVYKKKGAAEAAATNDTPMDISETFKTNDKIHNSQPNADSSSNGDNSSPQNNKSSDEDTNMTVAPQPTPKDDANVDDDIVMDSADLQGERNNNSESIAKSDAIAEVAEEDQSQAKANVNAGTKKAKVFDNQKFERFLNELFRFFVERKFNDMALMGPKLSRVCITSLGSPLWYEKDFAKDIVKFLTILRATIRSQNAAVCFITMPMHLIRKSDETLVPKIRNLVDYAIELESFAGSEREMNPAFKEYNGLFHIRKMTAINTLRPHMPDTYDLAFKLRRKKFIIETFHLPPELQESASDAAATHVLDDENIKPNALAGNGAVVANSAVAPKLDCASNSSTNSKVFLDF